MGRVILFDREEVGDLIPVSVFYRKWVPGEPEAVACDYADVVADGPFLMRANDEHVWVSHGNDHWLKVAQNPRYDGPDQKRWSALVTLYASAEGLTLRNLTHRIRGVKRRLREQMGEWFPWDEVYIWNTGSELVWDGLMNHPWLETREHDGRKEVRHVRRTA